MLLDRYLILDDLQNAKSPEGIATLFGKLGYHADVEPMNVEDLELSPQTATAVNDAYLIADEGNGKLQVWLFHLTREEFKTRQVAKNRMEAIARSLCQRGSDFLILGTYDYKDLILVKPSQSLDAHFNLQISIKHWWINLTNPDEYDRHRLETISSITDDYQKLSSIHYESFKILKNKRTTKNNANDLIRSYLHQIGRIPLLQADEEIELGRQVQQLQKLKLVRENLREKLGSKPNDRQWADAANLSVSELCALLKQYRKAKDKIVVSNLRLVISLAKKYQNRGLEFLDLIQEGNLGLIRAAEKFDPTKGYKFSTYATWWIRQAITRAIYNQSRLIRLPVHLFETISKIKKISQKISLEKKRHPTLEKIAAFAEITIDELLQINNDAKPVISLDASIGSDEDSALVDCLQCTRSTVEDVFSILDVDILLKTLKDRDRDVIRMRYGLDDGREKTLEEIGQRFNLTRERIRQLEAKALRKLKENIKLDDRLIIQPVHRDYGEGLQVNNKKKYVNNKTSSKTAIQLMTKNYDNIPIQGAKSAELIRKIESLEKVFIKQKNRLSQSIDNLQVTGIPVPLDLLKELNESRKEFEVLREEIRRRAESMKILAETNCQIDSISQLKSLLEDIIKSEISIEKEKEKLAKVRQEALTVLQNILAIAPINNSDLALLQNYHAQAKKLSNTISRIENSPLPLEAEALISGDHPLVTLLKLISERDSSDYQLLQQLQATIAQSYDGDLAMAALTGKLIIKEKSPSEVATISTNSNNEVVTIHQSLSVKTVSNIQTNSDGSREKSVAAKAIDRVITKETQLEIPSIFAPFQATNKSQKISSDIHKNGESASDRESAKAAEIITQKYSRHIPLITEQELEELTISQKFRFYSVLPRPDSII